MDVTSQVWPGASYSSLSGPKVVALAWAVRSGDLIICV